MWMACERGLADISVRVGWGSCGCGREELPLTVIKLPSVL